jgi:UDP-N-acetylmuramoylalanine--D-glutamate ligase
MFNFTITKFGVVGTGDTGLSIINYLQFHKAQIVRIYDTRDNPPNIDKLSAFNICCGKLDYNNFCDVDVIIISPGISIFDPALVMAKNNNKIVINDIGIFALSIKEWPSKVIAITGSNGKSTVTALTGHLSASYGKKTLIAGNIGVPVLNSYLDIITTQEIPEVIVLELSSFQLECDYSIKLSAATVLNISEDHLDRYRDLLEYSYYKSNIFNNCAVQVLNHDDNLVVSMQRHNKVVRWFGSMLSDHFTIANNYLIIEGKQYICCEELSIIGQHNYYNALVSLALIQAIGIDINDTKLKDGLKSFTGLLHRMQKIVTHNEITFIEDSKGTNVGAVIAGVSGLSSNVHLILGGDGKGQDFSPLRQLIISKCKSVAIIGQDKFKILDTLTGLSIPVQIFDSLPDAVSFCYSMAKRGDYVVLSPACASWDMFDNYKHRAKVFVESVYDCIK